MLSRRGLLVMSLSCVGGAALPAWAQEKRTADILPSTEQPAIDVRSNLEDLVNQYVEDKGLGVREARGEISVMKGYAPVSVPSNDPDWVKYRVLAFEKALKEAKSEWISQQNKSVTSKIVASSYLAANQDPPPYKSDDLVAPAHLAEIVAKIQALGGGYLDQALRELNIDPARFEKIPPAQRHVQLSKEILRTVTTRSVGDLVGLTTVQTFEGHNGQGNHEIAVIAVASPKMKTFAQSVLRLRGNFTPDPSKAQDFNALIRNKDALLQDFGIRWLYDQSGFPAIASFYQWGLDNTGNDRVLSAQVRDLAVKQATELADAQIAQFLAASATLTSTSTTGERYEKAVERAVDGYVTQLSPSSKLIDGLDDIFEERAHVENVTGLRTLTSWGARHPLSNQMVVGVVRVWSAASEMATRAVKDARPLAPPSAPAHPQAGPAGTAKGRDLNSADDF